MAPGPGRASRANAVPVSAELIRREAIRLFGERTYPVIGMRDLSEAVGILPGSLYAHITSKEQLLLSIVEEGIAHYLEALAPLLHDGRPADVRLRAAMHSHMSVLAGTREQTRVTFEQWGYLGPENRERVLALRQRYLDVFLSFLRDGAREGVFRALPHPKVAALSIIGALNSATEWFDPAGPDGPAEIADALADNVLHGLLEPGQAD